MYSIIVELKFVIKLIYFYRREKTLEKSNKIKKSSLLFNE